LGNKLLQKTWFWYSDSWHGYNLCRHHNLHRHWYCTFLINKCLMTVLLAYMTLLCYSRNYEATYDYRYITRLDQCYGSIWKPSYYKYMYFGNIALQHLLQKTLWHFFIITMILRAGVILSLDIFWKALLYMYMVIRFFHV
jgi:hypothetical protein